MTIPVKFILASKSPRRKELLKGLSLEFGIHAADIDESPLPNESPEDHCLRAALGKGEIISDRHPGALVLGADTSVIIDGKIFGKPKDKHEAQRMLGELSGRWHTVITAFALLLSEKNIKVTRLIKSEVFIRELSPAQIKWYTETGEPMDKAGAYAIQGLGASLVKEVRGSYTCVVGLPLAETVEELEKIFGPDCLLGG